MSNVVIICRTEKSVKGVNVMESTDPDSGSADTSLPPTTVNASPTVLLPQNAITMTGGESAHQA